MTRISSQEHHKTAVFDYRRIQQAPPSSIELLQGREDDAPDGQVQTHADRIGRNEDVERNILRLVFSFRASFRKIVRFEMFQKHKAEMDIL